MNVAALNDDDLKWADYVFVSAMIAQKISTQNVIDRCMALGVKTVGGGPLFNSYADDFPGVDHLVLGEGEVSLPLFLEDLQSGSLKPRYCSEEHPRLEGIPVPKWGLIDLKKYAAMSIQYSRGCPFNCEFCDIIIMNGRLYRTKSNEQMLAELDALYKRGWRGSVFFVDDNFIGNKKRVKRLLSEIIQWQRLRKRPFHFFTEASVDLAEDEELMNLMVEAGFDKVFLGLETPSLKSLQECGKYQNLKRNLSESVRIIQSYGLAVMGGFIIGFDNDPPDIFESQVNFIQKTGVVTAMIGLLTAIPRTRLYKRLEQEGRILFKTTGNNTSVDGSLNFVPKMDRQVIVNGYQWVMNTLYSPEMFYKRIQAFLRDYRPRARGAIVWNDIFTFLRSLWYLGVVDKTGTRAYYWRLLRETMLHSRRSFSAVVTMLIYGYHFRRLYWTPQFSQK